MKRPAFQFYPADWRKDAAVQSCSIAARGLWHEMLCIMHECEPYGHLTVNGLPMTIEQLARLAGVAPRECGTLLAEIERSGASSRSAEGALFCRRMVKDEAIRNARAAGGEAGSDFGARGAEHGKKGGRPKKTKGGLKTPLPEPEKPSPSSSSSTSTSVVPIAPLSDAPGASDPPASSPSLEPAAKPADNVEFFALPLFMVRASKDLEGREDWSKPLFQNGLEWLAKTEGKDPDKLRSLIGKWLKAAGQDHKRVFDLIVRADRERVASPIEWITKTLGGNNDGPRRGGQEQLTGTAAAIAGIARAAHGG